MIYIPAMKLYTVLVFFCTSVVWFSCKSFVYKKKIAERYYIIGVDSRNDLTLSRRLGNGDYIGRIPAKVIGYGIADSLLIGKSIQNGIAKYYIINMKGDNDYAHESDYLLETLSEEDFMRNWLKKFKINQVD